MPIRFAVLLNGEKSNRCSWLWVVKIIEGNGSRIAVVHKDIKATFHRPHPGKEALRYRVKAARDFLKAIGVKP